MLYPAIALILVGLIVWLLLAPTIGLIIFILGLVLLIVALFEGRRGRADL